VALRVRVWRRLQQVGAVAIKNSVYALPLSDSAREDFQWIAREVTASGGEGTVCAAELVDGMTDAQVRGLFHAAREAQYAELTREARQLAAGREQKGDDGFPLAVSKLRKRLSDVVAIDFFGARGREAAEGLIGGLESRAVDLGSGEKSRTTKALPPPPQGATWVTRQGIYVDRIASAWLIRRFIDRAARFRYVDPRTYRHRPGDLRFDMFEAEFTHVGDLCTFEVLLSRFGLGSPGLQALAEMVHDIDLKDGKYGRAETAGFQRMISGIVLRHDEDQARLERATALLEDLLTAFERDAPPVRERRRAKESKGARRAARRRRKL
jgi:hypothetical protein